MGSKRKNNTAHARTLKKQKPATFKDLPKEKQLLYKILTIAAAVIVILLIVLYKVDMLPHLDGSLQFRGDKLIGASENDLVINRESGRYGENGRYFIVGNIDQIEGYTPYPELISASDSYRQAFAFKPADAEDTFMSSVVIQGCLMDYEDLIGNILGENSEDSKVVYSEQFDGVSPVKGNVYHGATRTNYERDPETGLYVKFINAYIENGVKDSCVMVQISYKNAYKKEIPSDEQALSDIIEFIDKVNVK
ncbi:MAG: hypothetical protein IJB25_04930 [Clostridia bacterium]|nr:hypothetical protein [Clostridia bacterium]